MRCRQQSWRQAIRTGALLLVSGSVFGVEPADPPSGIADPFGLGERLALVSWLRERGEAIPDADDLAALRRRYAALTASARSASASHAEDAERARLALALWVRYRISAPPQADAPALAVLLAEQDALAAAERERERRWAAEREAALAALPVLPGPASPASAAAPANAATAALASALPASAPAGGLSGSASAAGRLVALREVPMPAATRVKDAMAAVWEDPDSPAVIVSLMGRQHLLIAASALLADDGARAKVGIRRTVVIIGHSDGALFEGFAGSDDERSIAGHFARHRTWYATLASSASAAPADLVVVMGCNPAGHNMERELRLGFDYLPRRRIVTPEGALSSAVVVLPALRAILSHPADARTRLRSQFTYVDKHGRYDIACTAITDPDDLADGGTLRRFRVERSGAVSEDIRP